METRHLNNTMAKKQHRQPKHTNKTNQPERTNSHTKKHHNSYQTDFPDLTGWLNQNTNSGKKAKNDTVDALSEADHKAKSGKVPNLNPMNKYIYGGK